MSSAPIHWTLFDAGPGQKGCQTIYTDITIHINAHNTEGLQVQSHAQ